MNQTHCPICHQDYTENHHCATSISSGICEKCVGPKTWEKGFNRPHETVDYYCCACAYDIAVFEGKLKSQRHDHKILIKTILETKDREISNDLVISLKKFADQTRQSTISEIISLLPEEKEINEAMIDFSYEPKRANDNTFGILITPAQGFNAYRQIIIDILNKLK